MHKRKHDNTCKDDDLCYNCSLGGPEDEDAPPFPPFYSPNPERPAKVSESDHEKSPTNPTKSLDPESDHEKSPTNPSKFLDLELDHQKSQTPKQIAKPRDETQDSNIEYLKSQYAGWYDTSETDTTQESSSDPDPENSPKHPFKPDTDSSDSSELLSPPDSNDSGIVV